MKIMRAHNIQNFCGIKKTIRIGEEAVRQFKQEYPTMVSISAIQYKFLQHHDSELYRSILFKLSDKIDNLIAKYFQVMELFNNTDKLTPELEKKVVDLTAKLNYGDCAEQSIHVAQKLAKMGEKPVYCAFALFNMITGRQVTKRFCPEHQFLVLGQKLGAKMNNPKTWGSNAVIVDPWLNMVLPAKQAIDSYNSKFRVADHETMIFFGGDNLCQ